MDALSKKKKISAHFKFFSINKTNKDELKLYNFSKTASVHCDARHEMHYVTNCVNVKS